MAMLNNQMVHLEYAMSAMSAMRLPPGLAILSWTAPASDGSSSITGYRVQRRWIRGAVDLSDLIRSPGIPGIPGI